MHAREEKQKGMEMAKELEATKTELSEVKQELEKQLNINREINLRILKDMTLHSNDNNLGTP